MRTKNTAVEAEVIQSIRKYGTMLKTAANATDDIKAAYDKLTDPKTANLDGMPRQRNPQAGEERLAAGIDLIDAMRERYRAARTFLLWFEPMWEALREEEREILETYKRSDRYNGEMERYAADHYVSLRQAHRLRRKAAGHLQELLFGCL